MSTDQVVLKVIQYAALLLALCVHEFSHAAVARWLGDHTAEERGRLTLNPLAHVDPIGTVLLPLLGFFTAFPLFGWAKPVPGQPANFRRGWFGRGQVLVAAGGPASNLLQALAWALVLAVTVRLAPDGLLRPDTPFWFFVMFGVFSVVINLILMAFNLLPVPPLDGSHVASWGLPRRWAEKYDAVMEPYGFVFLLLLFPFLGFLLRPVLWAGNGLVDLALGA
jgi:Zn-dependent protease